MFRKQKIVAAAFVLVMCVMVFAPAFESKAAAYTFNAPYNEPDYGENCGYVSILVDNPNAGYILYTFVWNFTVTGSVDGNPFTSNMDITVNQKSVVLEPYGSTTYFYTLFEMNSGGSFLLHRSTGYGGGNAPALTSSFNGPIVAVTMKGNYGTYSWYDGSYTPILTITWANEVSEMSQLISIYNQLVTANANDTTIISKLNSIMSSNASIDSKLSQLIELQKETNSWLEKIFNWLKDSPEQEKQEAQTQGNQSTSDATSAITDNSQGFIDSLGGLANSMSYSGTECAWTFPAITLPAIPGVMDSYQLTSEQPIDFSYWVNQIPANLLLLIQSLLTIALIIYCVKEVYGTISYVLTLRGGGSE